MGLNDCLRPPAWALLFLQLAVGTVASSPRCICHDHGLVLAQQQGPCECGSSANLTPRDELLSMTKGELLKKRNDLKTEVDDLQAKVESELGIQQQELDKLNSKLSGMKDQKKKQHEAYMNQTMSLSGHKAGVHDDLDEKQAQVAEVHTNITEIRDYMQKLRSRTAYLTGILAGCDISKCYKGASLLKVHKASLRGVPAAKGHSSRLALFGQSATSTAMSSPQYELVFEVQSLEQKRVDLEKKASKQVFTFAEQQRSLLDRMDVARIELTGQKLRNRDSEEYSSKTRANLEQQMRAVELSLQAAQGQLKRLEVDKKAADERVSDFVAEIQRCGC